VVRGGISKLLLSSLWCGFEDLGVASQVGGREFGDASEYAYSLGLLEWLDN